MRALIEALMRALVWLDGAGELGRWIAVSHTRAELASGARPLRSLRAGFCAWREWQRVPLIHRNAHHRSPRT